MDDKLNKQIDERIRKATAFTVKQTGDTPTDALQFVNRKYVTLNGITANRPIASVLGQHYFDTTLGIPVWWNGTAFVDATGSPV